MTTDPFARLDALQWFGIKLGLANPRRLAERLGHPEAAYPSVLVAGTNGKGSVAAMVARALDAHGYRTALYTSPHLVHLEERFRFAGQRIARPVLAAILDRIYAAMDDLLATHALESPATYFEVTTLAALEWFARERADVAVIEVGLGGRFDATNIVPQRVGVITSIAFDHEAHLGRTLGAIAFEKAGIIKEGAPTVLGPLPTEAAAVVRDVGRERDSALVDALSGVDIDVQPFGDRLQVTFATAARTIGPVVLGLRGRHQVVNVAIAVAALDALARTGLAVSPRAIEEGVRSPDWPGRVHVVTLAGGRSLILDGAHNEAGVEALAAYLAESHPRLPIVFGVMRDKAIPAMLARLEPVASRFVCTEVPMARAKSADELAALAAASCPTTPVIAEADPRVAIARAFDRDASAVVAGSLYLVGHVLGLIEAGTLW